MPDPTCPKCGDPLGATKNKATHHRRFCRPKLVERLAAVVRSPLRLAVTAEVPGVGEVRLATLSTGFTVWGSDDVVTHPTADGAATDFLARVWPAG